MRKSNIALMGPVATQPMLMRWCAFLTVWLVLCDTAVAQQEQWLQYRTSTEAETVVGKTPGQEIKLAATRPEELEMPKSAPSDPLFGRWKTPMVPAGSLWLVLDRSRGSGTYDRLFIDTDADGSLADETAVRAYQSGAYGDRQSAVFRQVKVLLPGEDGPMEFHLDLSFWMRSAKDRHLVAKPAGWYEGAVNIPGKKVQLALFDANANGAFDDASLDFQNSDRIKLTIGSRPVVGKVGKYIRIDDVFYRFDVSSDGAFVRFAQPDEGALGTLRVSENLRKISAGGRSGLFFLPVSDGLVRLPVGEYRLNHWELQLKDKSGNSWRLVAAAPVDGTVFEVDRDKQAALDVGEPVIATFSVSKQGSTYRFSNPALKGRNGERVTFTRNNRKPPLPKLRITNRDGTYDRRFSFEYG